MPRPYKLRRICSLPNCDRFIPHGCGSNRPIIRMTLDEFECIRLIDLENRTQEQCAAQMNVARTTVQAIYSSARSKLAECLVYQKELRIEGGDYVICDGMTESCECAGQCKKHCPHNPHTEN